jgi:hypothetical protein
VQSLRRGAWSGRRTVEQRIDANAYPGANRAEDQGASCVLAEHEIRVAYGVSEGNAGAGTDSGANGGAVQQTIARLCMGLACAGGQRQDERTGERNATCKRR